MDGTRETHRTTGTLGFALGVLALFLAPSVASAQVLSPLGNLSLNATVASSLTISIPSGGTMNFALADGAIANGSAVASITTSWSVNPGQTNSVQLFGYFSSPSAALAGTGYNLASTYVEGRVATGAPTAFTAFTQTNTVGPAGGSLLLFSELITGINKTKTRTDNLEVRINLTSSPGVPAGSYTGLLRIQARAL